MMRLSWVELMDVLSERLKQNDYQNLTAVIENINALNYSYETKPLYFERINSCLDVLSEQSLSKEQIKEQIQTLSECLQEITQHDIKPLMHSQLWFMDRMKAVGYKISGQGECYGISHMAIQAFFAHDMDTFNKRLKKIYDMPIEDFNNDFAQLRERKQQLLKNGLKDEAEEMNQTIVDLSAFFDGIQLNQSPMFYLPDEKGEPLSRKQDVRKTRPITMPVSLETKDARGKNPNEPTIIATFPGIYNEKNLEEYLDLLKKNLGEHSFALNFIATAHSISLIYDAKKACWLLFDPTNLPGEEYIHTQFLAKALFLNFLELMPSFRFDPLFIKTQITTIASHQQHMKSQLNNLQKTSAWSKLHDLSKWNEIDKIQKILSIAVSSNLDNELLLQHAINSEQYEFLRPFLEKEELTNYRNVFEKSNTNKLKSLLNHLPLDVQYKLLENLSGKKISEIYPAFNDWKSFFHKLPENARIRIFGDLIPYKKGDLLTLLPQHGIPETEQLRAFKALAPQVQSDLKTKFPEAVTKLLEKLSIDEKLQMIKYNFEYYRKGPSITMFAESEQVPIFLKLEPEIQAQCLIETPATDPKERQRLLNSLTIEEIANIMWINKSPEFWSTIFAGLSESQCEELFTITHKASSYTIMRYVGQDAALQHLLMNVLTEDSLFIKVVSEIHCFDKLPVTDLRSILLKGMTYHQHEIPALDFENIKQKINQANTRDDLEKLSATLNTHLNYYNICSSMNNLSEFSYYKSLLHAKRSRPEAIDNESKLFIIQLAVATIKKYVNENISPDCHADVEQFIDTIAKDGEEKELVETIFLLSQAANVLEEQLNEEKSEKLFQRSLFRDQSKKSLGKFIKGAQQRKIDDKSKEQDQVLLKEKQACLKTGIQEFKSDNDHNKQNTGIAPIKPNH